MTMVRIRGLKLFKDPQGKVRVYHRKTGRPIKSPLGSTEFLLEVASLDRLVAEEKTERDDGRVAAA